MVIALAILIALALLVSYVKDTRHANAIDRLLDAHNQYRLDMDAGYQASLAQLAEHFKPEPHPDIAQLVALVDRLCQRLQAPDHAVVEHAQAQPLPPMPQAVLPDDDEGWHRAQALTKEQLAEQAMAAELNA